MYFPSKRIITDSRSIFKSKLLLYYLAGFLIIYLSPENILSGNKYLSYICNSISYYIMSINKWSHYSPFPEITKIYFTYCWLSIPFQTVSLIKDNKSEAKFVNKWKENKKINYLRLPLLIILICSLFYFSANYAIVDSKPCFVCVNSSKFAQALIGGLIPFVNAGMLTLVYWLFKNYKQIFQQKEGRNK